MLDDALVLRSSRPKDGMTGVSILVVLDDALVRMYCIPYKGNEHVSILIVLDDALVQSALQFYVYLKDVSILIVLDDALVLVETVSLEEMKSGLNPYCAGRCSSTGVVIN